LSAAVFVAAFVAAFAAAAGVPPANTAATTAQAVVFLRSMAKQETTRGVDDVIAYS
jgi:hypothetical protein